MALVESKRAMNWISLMNCVALGSPATRCPPIELACLNVSHRRFTFCALLAGFAIVSAQTAKCQSLPRISVQVEQGFTARKQAQFGFQVAAGSMLRRATEFGVLASHWWRNEDAVQEGLLRAMFGGYADVQLPEPRWIHTGLGVLAISRLDGSGDPRWRPGIHVYVTLLGRILPYASATAGAGLFGDTAFRTSYLSMGLRLGKQ